MGPGHKNDQPIQHHKKIEYHKKTPQTREQNPPNTPTNTLFLRPPPHQNRFFSAHGLLYVHIERFRFATYKADAFRTINFKYIYIKTA